MVLNMHLGLTILLACLAFSPASRKNLQVTNSEKHYTLVGYTPPKELGSEFPSPARAIPTKQYPAH